MSFSNLEYSVQDGVALIRLAKPGDRSNALGTSFLRELRGATELARDSGEVNLLLFTGKDRTFSAGADLAEMEGFTQGEVLDFLHAGQSLVRLIMDLDIVTVAAVNGLALGGGLELALACDIRWAHARAVFGLPEAGLGLIPGWGGIPLLRRVMTASANVELLAGGGYLSARKAFDAGLVSLLFDGADFEEQALTEARKTAAGSGDMLQGIKERLKREKGGIDLAAGDRTFLELWNERQKTAKARKTA
jgi:enoyl-CoA hydratase